jgi:hypothetical protein
MLYVNQEVTVKRTNLYLTEKQIERLQRQSAQEGLSLAELVRRAVDAFLAWNDPTYHPDAPAPKQGSRTSSPA